MCRPALRAELYRPAWLVPARAEGGHGRFQPARAGCRQWPGTSRLVDITAGIWKPIPVRIFYTFVIYQGYDMDILSEKRYDVIYHRYDMDIPNANNLEWHILVIYFLTFGQIF